MKRMFAVGRLQGRRGICEACRREDHTNCEPVPVRVNGFGLAVDGTSYVDCSCLCDPKYEEREQRARVGV